MLWERGMIRGHFKRNCVAIAAGILRVLYDEDSSRPRTVGHQRNSSCTFGLFRMQERAAEGTTAREPRS